MRKVVLPGVGSYEETNGQKVFFIIVDSFTADGQPLTVVTTSVCRGVSAAMKEARKQGRVRRVFELYDLLEHTRLNIEKANQHGN